MARPIVLLLTILLSLAGCGGTPARDPLEGTAWLLLSLHGRPPLEGTRITLGFSDGFVSGSAGCNSYAPLVIAGQEARYRYRATADGRLSIPGFVITQVGCMIPQGVMEQETAYLDALRGAAAYRLAENRLEIQDAGGEITLVFVRLAE